MRRDGFSVSSNGKLGQPADVAALMKEAQACLLSNLSNFCNTILTQVLHRITLQHRSSAELQAFFTNVFNALALHAWCIDRWPTSPELLYPGCPCWRALRYSIAGFDYSLEDILTGILRGRKCSQLQPDPRILCVLAMAPSSLPPPTLTAARLDLDLDRAVRRFCLHHVSPCREWSVFFMSPEFCRSAFQDALLRCQLFFNGSLMTLLLQEALETLPCCCGFRVFATLVLQVNCAESVSYPLIFHSIP